MLAVACDLDVLAGSGPGGAGVAADVETTARGAAMLAASGAGLHGSGADASAMMSREGGEPLLPDPERQAIYDDAYALYRALYDALRPVFALGAGRG